MKIITKLRSSHSLIVASALIMVIFLGACKDEEEISVGPPSIERVRNTDPNTADSSFTYATLGSTLAIIGNNLLGTQQVYLNDYPVGINTAYVTNNTVIVQVADSVPTVATDPNVSNTLRLVNKSGEAIIEFQTLPPAPQITQVKNQYVKSGDELSLYGKYFYFVDSVYFPGEDVYVTTGVETNSSGSILKVKVPENMDFSEGQSIRVVTKSGGSAVNRNTQIYAENGMIADFDTNGVLQWPWGWGWGISGEMILPSQLGITALEGNFAGMDQAFPAGYGWNNDKVINISNSQQIFPQGEGYESNTPATDFDLRFELAVNSEESINGLMMQIWYPDSQGNELSYNIPISDFVTKTDGSWYSLSTNMTRLTNGSTRLSTYGDFLKGDSKGEKQLRLVVINTTSKDITAVLGVDNVRVVRAVY